MRKQQTAAVTGVAAAIGARYPDLNATETLAAASQLPGETLGRLRAGQGVAFAQDGGHEAIILSKTWSLDPAGRK